MLIKLLFTLSYFSFNLAAFFSYGCLFSADELFHISPSFFAVSPMESPGFSTFTLGRKSWWDPYETSYKKQFINQPNSAAEILCPMSASFIDSYSKSGPFGSTVYNKDFYWKPSCKPECIRTGTASGQRRNNPDAARNSEYVVFPWKCPPSEGEIRKALTAQYSSTYACDFMGLPQGTTHLLGQSCVYERRSTWLQVKRHMPLSADTETRASYRQPKPELLGNLFHYSCKKNSNLACCGIVPTVVQRHIHTQKQKGSDVTTYDRFYGKRVGDVTSVIKSLLPQELQQLHRVLPEEVKMLVQTTGRK
uniref:Testis expressed 26 n=1 Tax=Amphiprion percula TaxID=161767 RepID=A0A3P8SM64_AMPPE